MRLVANYNVSSAVTERDSQSVHLANYTHCGCDVTDVGPQVEGESGAKRRAGDEQQDCLHGLHEGAAELDRQFSARPVKITTANS